MLILLHEFAVFGLDLFALGLLFRTLAAGFFPGSSCAATALDYRFQFLKSETPAVPRIQREIVVDVASDLYLICVRRRCTRHADADHVRTNQGKSRPTEFALLVGFLFILASHVDAKDVDSSADGGNRFAIGLFQCYVPVKLTQL